MSNYCSVRVQIWQCEFCDERNVVDVIAEEKPREPDVTYMISPAPATAAISCQGDESSMVVFCIDVSGSMGGWVSVFPVAVQRKSNRLGKRSFLKPMPIWGIFLLHSKVMYKVLETPLPYSGYYVLRPTQSFLHHCISYPVSFGHSFYFAETGHFK